MIMYIICFCLLIWSLYRYCILFLKKLTQWYFKNKQMKYKMKFFKSKEDRDVFHYQVVQQKVVQEIERFICWRWVMGWCPSWTTTDIGSGITGLVPFYIQLRFVNLFCLFLILTKFFIYDWVSVSGGKWNKISLK